MILNVDGHYYYDVAGWLDFSTYAIIFIVPKLKVLTFNAPPSLWKDVCIGWFNEQDIWVTPECCLSENGYGNNIQDMFEEYIT